MPPLAARTARRILLVLPLMVIGLLGFGLAFHTSASEASPTCSLYAAPGGSDSAAGSASSPFATVGKLVAALAAGQTGCLASGATFTGDVSISHGGQAGAPITITSQDPASPATVKGRVATFPGGDWITFTSLIFNGVNATGLPSPTVGSDHVTFSQVDVSNGHTAICFDLINSSQWGVARYTTIQNSRIHDCGRLPYGSTNNDHGIYVSGFNTTITDNYIYGNSDRGVQLRGSQGAVVQHNVIDGNGEGVIFGDLSAGNNNVSYNIVSNSIARSNAESWWGTSAVGAGNTFNNNCVWATNANTSYDANGGINTGSGGFTATANRIVDPLFVDRANRNYALQPGSPCADFAPNATPPAPATTTAVTSTSAQTTTSGTTTATTTTTATPTTATTTTTTTTTQAPAPGRSGASNGNSKHHGTLYNARQSVGAAPPIVASIPAVEGAAGVGKTLKARVGSWKAAGQYHYIWLRCGRTGGGCQAIRGATHRVYRTTSADLGHRLRVNVIAQNKGGSTSATSGTTRVARAS